MCRHSTQNYHFFFKFFLSFFQGKKQNPLFIACHTYYFFFPMFSTIVFTCKVSVTRDFHVKSDFSLSKIGCF